MKVQSEQTENNSLPATEKFKRMKELEIVEKKQNVWWHTAKTVKECQKCVLNVSTKNIFNLRLRNMLLQ